MDLRSLSADEPGSAESPRLFANDLLDRFSRIHPLTPIVVYLPVAGLFLVLSWVQRVPLGLSVAFFALGYITWSFTEYFGHRFLFHRLLPIPRRMALRCQFLLHGVHHRYPADRFRLVMPLLMSIPILTLALLFLTAVLGRSFSYPTFAGFVSGYLLYDFIHHWVHTATPRSRLGRLLKTSHMRHHYESSATGFGVHALWCDSLFGTCHRPRRSQV